MREGIISVVRLSTITLNITPSNQLDAKNHPANYSYHMGTRFLSNCLPSMAPSPPLLAVPSSFALCHCLHLRFLFLVNLTRLSSLRILLVIVGDGGTG